jgi:UDP-N-acetylmuramoyl-tripeptide--D-alanyl-D-alanine ligase
MASLIPANDARFTLDEIVQATGAVLRPVPGGPTQGVVGVSSDSRAPLGGRLFVALRGERFDGHGFVADAARGGARALLVEDDVPELGVPVLRVPSTLTALGALARFHRRRWGGKVLCVGGAVGKTTTRSALTAVLAATGANVHSPRGNLNNQIGVPMVLLGLLPEHRYAVVEVGTNVTGEIGLLAAVAEPDAAVLTRIALEHSEGLGDLDAIEHEEGSLLAALRPGGVAASNADDARCLRQLERSPAHTRLTYGVSRHVSYRISRCDTEGPRGTSVRIERQDGSALAGHSPLLGLPGAYALAASIALSEALLGRALTTLELERALSGASLGEPGRLTPLELADGSLVLDDTYNASPESVLSSVSVARELADRRQARLVLVLGEMRELGAESELAHAELGAALSKSSPALVVAFGGHARLLADATDARNIETRFAPDAPAALDVLRGLRQAGDVILIKASRGLRAERIVQGLTTAGGAE